MDLSKQSNVIELKAIAYDILREKNRLSEDLEKVTFRILQLEQTKRPELVKN